MLLLELFSKKLFGILIVNDATEQMQHWDADGQLKVEKNVNLDLQGSAFSFLFFSFLFFC